MGRRRAYLLVALGCCLLANGLYADRLVPEGEYRFEATPVGDAPEERVEALADAGVLVTLPAEWAPVLRSASGAGETYRTGAGDLPPPGDRLLADGVRYASVGERLYLVAAAESDGAVTLSAARTTPDRALAAVAVPATGLPGPYARALTERTVETRLFTPRDARLVRTDGGHALVTVTPVSRYDGPLELLPMALYPAGYIVLLWGLLSHPSLPSDYTIAPASKG